MVTKKVTEAIDSFKKKRLRLKINLPIHPDAFSILSVALSFLVFYDAIAALIIVLLLDLLGGAVARARGMASYRGQVSDWLSDRFSEFIIFGFLALINIWFLVFPVLNIVLNILVAKKARISGTKFYILPIRQFLLAVLIGLYIIPIPYLLWLL